MNRYFIAGFGMDPEAISRILPSDIHCVGLSESFYLKSIDFLSIDHLSIDLYGHSFGGLRAIQLAAQYPKIIKKITLLSSTPCFQSKPGWRGISRSRIDKIFKTLDRDPVQFIQDFKKHCAYPESPEIFKNLFLSDSDILKNVNLINFMNLDLRECFSKITCPIQIFLGEKDAVTPRFFHLENLVGSVDPDGPALQVIRMTNLALHVLNNAGHLFPFNSLYFDLIFQ